MTPDQLLAELEPTGARLFERHRSAIKEWFPHELVPYERARPFPRGWRWTEADSDLAVAPEVRSALYLNLLTEDNLPYYFADIDRLVGRDGALGEWARWWTAEEGRHSIVIRDFLTVTRAVDPVELERARMAQVAGGESPKPGGLHEALVYLTLQELATRIAHRNTGKRCDDAAAFEVMARVAMDENLHHLFYRDLAQAAFELCPSRMVVAAERVVREFAMPGTGIPGFEAHARAIARAGIYDLAIFHEQILVPIVLRHWRVPELTGLHADGEAARDALVVRIERTGKVAARAAARRQEADERQPA